MKPGYKTSELFVVILGAIGSVLVGAGTLSPDEATQINEAGQVVASEAVQLVDAVTRFVQTLAPLVGSAVYAWSRTRIKLGV